MSDNSSIIHKCLFIDLEVAPKSGRIRKFAAIRGDSQAQPLTSAGNNIESALRALDDFAGGAQFVVGHNIIAHDLPHIKAAAPQLRLLRLPAIDTLRLSPLAFPRNPYHRLVKHYKDGTLLRQTPNDPELDARLSLVLFAEEEAALAKVRASNPALGAAFHWLFSRHASDLGFASFFDAVRDQSCPADTEGRAAINACLRDAACVMGASQICEALPGNEWPLAFSLAWLSVAGGNSVMPPWVRHEFPEAKRMVHALRNTRCDDLACKWCAAHHNPRRVLEQWFGFQEFRPQPACDDGRSMQEAIVEASMRGEHVLGILPTGTGKSICYQIPALSRYENTGALTIVISPLVALMSDQVHGLETRGVVSCAALNSLLSMPERADVLERVRLGDIAILLVSPEQLRNNAFRRAVAQREIGGWVLDEAHCLSKWGQDFRTDYRYIGRFIKESAGNEALPPVLCLTATAKPDVVADIRGYFLGMLSVELRVFNGGASRENLAFMVVETTPAHKLADIHQLLEDSLGDEGDGGAIVYCATRSKTEEMARALVGMGWAAAHFHAGLPPETKKNTQQGFISGQVRVIAATNAFGMGIDKPDVRLVVHAEMPGSLENYVQEAGRAGRDQLPARCVLLYCEQDIEKQFGLTSYSRLPIHEIRAVLRALRRMAGKHRPPDIDAEVVATSGEILDEDREQMFMRDSATDDTRVRTAISWLEEARLAQRDENRYQVFPSSLRIVSREEARARLAEVTMPYRGQLLAIVTLLLSADADEGVTTDDLMGASRLSSSNVARALHDLEKLGVLTNDSALTALVHAGVENSSNKRLDTAIALETALIALLRETAPDLVKDTSSVLHLRRVAQRLKDDGYTEALPDTLYRLLRGIAADGRSENQGIGSIRLRKIDSETLAVTLQRNWESLRKTAALRASAARALLAHLLTCIPRDARGNDLIATTTLGKLAAAIENDLELRSQVRDVPGIVERSLLWMHEQEVMRLGKGMVVFRPAMTIKVAPGNTRFTRGDYQELDDHYHEQIVQIHVMAEYAKRGLQTMRDAIQMVADYFTVRREDFFGRWFPQAAKRLSLQTTDSSWAAIVKTLDRGQRAIVKDERKQTNVLVLAGPGSGKTRVLVHRIAYLIRVMREHSRGILALAYNRHAALEIRKRLRALIDDDANGVTVLTCHALAMRLVGASFVEKSPDDDTFTAVMEDAVRLLRGDGLPPDDADAQRERLLAGFRWILVDEYQDIEHAQYELIAALAGRSQQDPEKRLSLFAVGDDDQNIYGFAGASSQYIKQFQQDYQAKINYLTENYRSTAHVITAANALIVRASNRMKAAHPITINETRKRAPAGGVWETRDPVVRGRVQILEVGPSVEAQAAMVMEELLRLAALDPAWDWRNVAVVARQWQLLNPLVAFCQLHGIPAQRADSDMPQFWRLRETQHLALWLNERDAQPLTHEELTTWFASRDGGPWWELLLEAGEQYRLECGDAALPAAHFREWLAEWGREMRRQQQGLLLLTAHRVKGLEFDHLAVLDGGWNNRDQDEDVDAARRLYYVAMTRARQTLLLARQGQKNRFLGEMARLPAVACRTAPPIAALPSRLMRRYETLTLGDVDIGFAGRLSPRAPIHKALAQLRPGDALAFVQEKDKWLLQRDGLTVGRLASSYTLPEGMRCIEARVHAVLVRFRHDGEPAYADTTRCDQWEVLLPELVFAPDDTRAEPAAPLVDNAVL